MFHVKIDTIRERTTNGPTYMKGRQYYRQGQIKHLTYDQEKGIILAQVDGTRSYDVRIILDGLGELHDASCTCSAFSAYWGLCKHIAAVLLYCIDAFGSEKTHILPADPAGHAPGRPNGQPGKLKRSSNAHPASTTDPADARESADSANAPDPVRAAQQSGDGDLSNLNSGDWTDLQSGTDVFLVTPGDIVRQQKNAVQQAQRRSRSKARDFLTRIDHVVQLLRPDIKQPIKLQVVLHCSRSSSTLPWLSFALGEHQLHPVANVEQFAEAVSRDLPLELDKDFTFNPLYHCFSEQDMPLIRMLQNAFENDYKSVFGTSHASSRDRFLTLNASRFAEFLLFSSDLSDCTWQSVKEAVRQPITIRQANLPISLLLADSGEAGSLPALPYRLELICDHNVQQMTSSRNIYLIGDIFYLPPYDSIRLLEPILSTFNTAGCHFLLLSHDEAVAMISEIGPRLAEACPLKLHADLQRKLNREPLQPHVSLDAITDGLKAEIAFVYGDQMINPLSDKSGDSDLADAPPALVVRDFAGEERLISVLQQNGFVRLGSSWRLTEPDSLYRFLCGGIDRLRASADVHLSEAAAAVRLLPPPAIRVHFSWMEGQDSLTLDQSFGDIGTEDMTPYLQALRDQRPYVRTRDGSFRQVNPEHRSQLPRLIDLLLLWNIQPRTQIGSLPRYRALAIESLLQDSLEKMRADESSGMESRVLTDGLVTADPAVFDLIHNLREPGSLSFRMPAAMRGILRPYQKTGVQWLCTLDYYGLGGILADDMGLGKTLQTITFVMMTWRRRKKPCLIIAPTSLVYNWLNEFEKFAPKLPVLLIDGNRLQRSSLFQDINRHACVITSYSLLRRDIDAFANCSFASCFLDEAQNIKNPDTLNARSVKQIQADRYFALTGTPIENTLLELWSIFDYILPGYLHSQKVFQNLFELPIVRDGSRTALEDLHRQVMPFVLRRMKRDVLKELPDKIESRTVCDMTKAQRQIYRTFLEQSRRDLEQEVDQNGYARSQIYILALLTRLRQICCHPSLFIRQYEGGSGKMLLLEELLEDSFASGHRVLLFSQFTSMLELIRLKVAEKGIVPFYIDGQVPAEDRVSQVRRFNEGENKLFLVSLRAGGTGLNLTGADTVIHYDPWWNPAVEEQATDRAYRIGQENVVQVFKLYTRHSVEEKILALQERKQNLIESIIKPGQNLLSKMTLDEVLSLFES